MTLDLSAAFHMTDASPILAVFDQNRKENKWLDRMLDLKNINGKMTIEAEPDSMTIPYAFLTSDTFDVGAKGIFGAERPPGRLLCKDRQARRSPRHRQQAQEILGHRRHGEVRGLQGRRPGPGDP